MLSRAKFLFNLLIFNNILFFLSIGFLCCGIAKKRETDEINFMFNGSGSNGDINKRYYGVIKCLLVKSF